MGEKWVGDWRGKKTVAHLVSRENHVVRMNAIRKWYFLSMRILPNRSRFLLIYIEIGIEIGIAIGTFTYILPS